MRIFKWMRFLLVIVVLNIVLSFLLEPARGASEMMWRSYYEQEEMDTIFVGSSLCKGTFNPKIFDERLGIKSFNMGTPSQAMSQTFRSVEVAMEDHDIKTVIYGMGYSSLKHDPLGEAELTFEKARVQQKGGVEGFLATLSYLYSEEIRNDEKSINFLFPWLYNREEISLEMIKYNVKLKLQYMKRGSIDFGAIDDKTFYKGYQNADDRVVNYDNRWEVNTYRHYEAEFNEGMMDELEKLMQLCHERDVDLIIINTPRPSFDTISCYTYYEANQQELMSLCDQYEVDYYDFNLAKQEAFESKPEYYADYEHLNEVGAEVFCESLCDFLIRRENGEEVATEFLTLDEFLDIYSFWYEEWQNYYW